MRSLFASVIVSTGVLFGSAQQSCIEASSGVTEWTIPNLYYQASDYYPTPDSAKQNLFLALSFWASNPAFDYPAKCATNMLYKNNTALDGTLTYQCTMDGGTVDGEAASFTWDWEGGVMTLSQTWGCEGSASIFTATGGSSDVATKALGCGVDTSVNDDWQDASDGYYSYVSTYCNPPNFTIPINSVLASE